MNGYHAQGQIDKLKAQTKDLKEVMLSLISLLGYTWDDLVTPESEAPNDPE